MSTQPSAAQLAPKMRRITLLLPLLLAAVMTMFFYGLGGGHNNTNEGAIVPGVQGINMTLPPPQFGKGKAPDKSGIYDQAALDSTRRAQQRKTDPYFVGRDTSRSIHDPGIMTLSKTDADLKADRLSQQLDEMRRALANHQVSSTTFDPGEDVLAEMPGNRHLPLTSPSLRQFNPSSTPHQFSIPPHSDPDLDRIDGVLEKLFRVQHPDLVRQDTQIKSEPPLLVSLATNEDEEQAGFMEITDNAPKDSLHNNAIPAEISADQTLTTGSSVELRLTEPVTIEGHPIPKYQLLRGTVSLTGERLTVSVNSIRVGQSILPVNLQAFDLDGIAGIRIPGAIIRDASKQSADQAINSLGASTIDPSLGAQAANAGLQFARSLATKKVRLIQVAVPAGYRLLLKNIHH